MVSVEAWGNSQSLERHCDQPHNLISSSSESTTTFGMGVIGGALSAPLPSTP